MAARLGHRALLIGVVALVLWAAIAPPALAREPALPSLSVVAPNLELAQHVRDIFHQSAPRLAQLTGGHPGRIKVEVAPDREAFTRRTKESGGPLWAAGLAIPGQGLILLRSPKQLTQPGDFRPLLIHELTHLYLAWELKGRHAPLWLEEGLAMYAAGQGGLAQASAMTRGVLSEKIKPFDELESRFPSGADEAGLAYAQSYYMVSYLLNTYGPEVLPRLLKELARDRTLTSALHKVTGHSLLQIEAGFKETMISRFSWLALLFAGSTLWALIGLTAGIALVWRRRRQRQRLKEMELLERDEKKDVEQIRLWPPPPVRGDVMDQAGLKSPSTPKPSPRTPGQNSS
jgi:hypothetical protein